jgi:DNA (cytosine-5)-methyltransferase 1
MVGEAYYNEFDPYAAQWLRNLIDAGHIAPGIVDERSIVDVEPADLVGFTQCHFFAGIGGWSLALRLAGWPDDRPVWTGSPPCQPFSTAGKQLGVKDERHLAPHFLALVAAVRPPALFGEQVAAAVNKDAWLDDLLDALEKEGYATGAAVSGAGPVGAPHIRQRLWFTARLGNALDTGLEGLAGHGDNGNEPGRIYENPARPVATPGSIDGLADPKIQRSRKRQQNLRGCFAGSETEQRAERECCGSSGGMAQSDGPRPQPWSATTETAGHGNPAQSTSGADRHEPTSPINSPWGAPDWLFCRDGKWRPVESGTFPLANGIPGRVGRLRAYGNAIVPQVAAEIIREVM